jgi:serine protease Do
MGIVSATGRANLGITEYEDFIQTDAAINPGNSGGALVTLDGRIVGINTAILSRGGGSLGIGFAIPSNMARPIMTSLMEHGRVVRGHLGIAIQDLDEDLAGALGVAADRGVVIADVAPRSPAARAGLRRGDVVLAIDGVKITDSARFRNEIAGRAPGSSVTLTLQRSGKQLRIPAKLEVLADAAPTPAASSGRRPAPPRVVPSDLGLEAAALTRDLRRRFRVPDSIEDGIVVVEVAPRGRAAAAGLRPGDVISAAGQHAITRPAQLRRAIEVAGKKPLALLVHRGGASAYLVLPEG